MASRAVFLFSKVLGSFGLGNSASALYTLAFRYHASGLFAFFGLASVASAEVFALSHAFAVMNSLVFFTSCAKTTVPAITSAAVKRTRFICILLILMMIV